MGRCRFGDYCSYEKPEGSTCKSSDACNGQCGNYRYLENKEAEVLRGASFLKRFAVSFGIRKLDLESVS